VADQRAISPSLGGYLAQKSPTSCPKEPVVLRRRAQKLSSAKERYIYRKRALYLALNRPREAKHEIENQE